MRNTGGAMLRLVAWLADQECLCLQCGDGAAMTDFTSHQDDPHFFSSLGGFSSSTRMGRLITLWFVRGSGKIAISILTMSFLL